MKIHHRFLYPIMLAMCTFSAAHGGVTSLGNFMLLGDSITQAAYNGDHQGYRYPLWQKLVDSGASFDYVGSHGHNFNSSNTSSTTSVSTYPDYSGHVFDTDNEGHWGWDLRQVLGETTPTRTPGTGSGKLSDWLGLNTVDTALILLGVNDLAHGYNVATTKTKMETVIGSIISENTGVKIYLASVLPTNGYGGNSHGTGADNISNLNLAYQDIAVNNASVTYLGIDDGFAHGTHTYDGIHPNALGEELIATHVFNSISVPEPSSGLFLSISVMIVTLRRAKR